MRSILRCRLISSVIGMTAIMCECSNAAEPAEVRRPIDASVERALAEVKTIPEINEQTFGLVEIVALWINASRTEEAYRTALLIPDRGGDALTHDVLQPKAEALRRVAEAFAAEGNVDRVIEIGRLDLVARDDVSSGLLLPRAVGCLLKAGKLQGAERLIAALASAKSEGDESLAGLAIAQWTSGERDAAARTIARIEDGLQRNMSMRRVIDLQISIGEAGGAIQAARRIPPSGQRAIALARAAGAYRIEGPTRDVEGLLSEAFEEAAHESDPNEAFLAMLAIVEARATAHFKSFSDIVEAAKTLNRRSGESRWPATVLSAVGRALALAGRNSEAAEAFLEAENLIRQSARRELDPERKQGLHWARVWIVIDRVSANDIDGAIATLAEIAGGDMVRKFVVESLVARRLWPQAIAFARACGDRSDGLLLTIARLQDDAGEPDGLWNVPGAFSTVNAQTEIHILRAYRALKDGEPILARAAVGAAVELFFSDESDRYRGILDMLVDLYDRVLDVQQTEALLRKANSAGGELANASNQLHIWAGIAACCAAADDQSGLRDALAEIDSAFDGLNDELLQQLEARDVCATLSARGAANEAMRWAGTRATARLRSWGFIGAAEGLQKSFRPLRRSAIPN
ncbi:MAG TPA: hypothetical protein VKU82_10620 [Planctomycetaceae bacterium]|nr:hypothetical protein [Planctomycetaceae bacterium]